MQQVSSDLRKAVDPNSGKDKVQAVDAVAETQWRRYVRARDHGHDEYLVRAKRCDDFYLGDQWDEADKAALEEDGRPALTINMVLSTVNQILGEQVQSRADVKFKNRRGGSEAVADVLNKLWMIDSDRNQFEWMESQVFADGIIRERGWFDVRIDFDENLQGEIKITSDDSSTIIIDPDGKEYDPRTWSEIFVTRWMSLDEIEAQYGKEKRREVEGVVGAGQHYKTDSVRFERGATFGGKDHEDEPASFVTTEEADERNIRLVRVIERQYYKLAPVHSFVDVDTGDTRQAPGDWTEEQRQAFADKFGLGQLKRIARKVRWTVTADKVVLHDEWSPYASFTKIPYFPYFRRGRPIGVVTNLLSPQEQLNKIESQILHIVNTTANSGWVVESGSLVNMTADDLREQGAQTGLVLEYGPNKNPPDKIKPNTIPTGLDRVAQKAANNVRVISGVNEGQLGMQSAEVSGVALEGAIQQGQTQIMSPLDNLARTRYLVANKCLELWQQFYTEERIFEMTHDVDPSKGNQEVVINGQDEEGIAINDISVGRYDVVIGTQPARDSFNDTQFAEALSLRNVGIEIPGDRVVEYSNLARKTELAQEMRDMAGRGEITEEQQKQMQFQQEIDQRMAIATVEKMQAEINNLQAQGALAAAKAEKTAGGIDSPEFQMEREHIEAKIQEKREELQLRMRLNEMSSISKLDISALGARNKLTVKAMDNQAKQQQPKPTQSRGR